MPEDLDPNTGHAADQNPYISPQVNPPRQNDRLGKQAKCAGRYEHFGMIPMGGVILTAAAGLVSAAALGFAYSHVSYAAGMVQVWFKVPLTVLFGISIGLATGWGARQGHVRSTVFPAGIAFLAGLVGLYFAWAADFTIRIGVGANGNVLTAFEPNALLRYMGYFYTHGLWGFRGGGLVKGTLLGLYWVGEGVGVLVTSSAAAWYIMTNTFYCEKCERWTKSEKNILQLSFSADPSAVGRIASGDVALLCRLPVSQDEAEFLRLDLATCESCDGSNFLTVKRVKRTVDKRGNVRSVATTVARGLEIGPERLVPPPGNESAFAKRLARKYEHNGRGKEVSRSERFTKQF